MFSHILLAAAKTSFLRSHGIMARFIDNYASLGIEHHEARQQNIPAVGTDIIVPYRNTFNDNNIFSSCSGLDRGRTVIIRMSAESHERLMGESQRAIKRLREARRLASPHL